MRTIADVLMVSLAAPGIVLAAAHASTRAAGPQGSAGTGHFNGWIDTDTTRHPGSRDAFGCHSAWGWDGLKYDLLLATAPLNYSALWWDAAPCVFAGDDQDAGTVLDAPTIRCPDGLLMSCDLFVRVTNQYCNSKY